jgi:hypothetical protein
MFTWDDPLAIYPLRKDDRLTNQGGYFTIHGNNILTLNKRKGAHKYLRMIEIPESAVTSAFEFLDAAGVNTFTMYPDLDGLAKYLNKKYL